MVYGLNLEPVVGPGSQMAPPPPPPPSNATDSCAKAVLKLATVTTESTASITVLIWAIADELVAISPQKKL